MRRPSLVCMHLLSIKYRLLIVLPLILGAGFMATSQAKEQGRNGGHAA
ncbi:hypothetical protein ACPJXG_27695 [Janthinobacterium sp. NFX145]